MFDRLGRDIARRPRLTIAIWLVVVAASFALAMTGFGGPGLFDRLHSGEPRVAGSESDRAAEVLAEHATGGQSVTLVVQGVDLTDPEALGAAGRAAATLHTRLLGSADVTVVDPFVFPTGPAAPEAAPFLSTAQDGFVVTVTAPGDLDAEEEDDLVEDVIAELRDFPERIGPDVTGIVSSGSLMTSAVVEQVEQDLTTGEMVALPISLLIMVVVFGGFLAAGMPLAGAIASIAGGLGALLGFSYVIELDSVVVNVVTVLGLGLSIDYGLLIVSRFREEIRDAVAAADEAARAGRRSRDRGRVDPAVSRALRATMVTAGRTVSFSAITVAISIAGLMLMRPEILRSLGAAGVSVVVIAVTSALTLVPALLALMGRRMTRHSALSRVPGLRTLLAKLGEIAPEEGFFSRLSARVQRRPWLVLAGVTAVLLVLASPLANLQLRNSTVELLPSDSDQRDFLAVLAADYPLLAQPTLEVLVEGDAAAAAELAEVVAGLPDVDSVDPATAVGTGYQVLGVRVDTDDPGGEVATGVVHEIRDLREGGILPEFWVQGQAANQVDFIDALVDGLPWAAGIVVLATFVLLFGMTGSLLVPLKALLINVLSLAASLGVTAWIFAEGHLEGLLGFTSAGGLESYVVAVVVAFGFGLAMDYEVFLLARIKEVYDAEGDNDLAVRVGLQRSGRIITSAALVIMVVFAGFVAGDLLVIKEVGVALAVTVLIDATLVRMLLVPATMTLLGHRNWWAPAPLRRLYRRFAIHH